MIDGDGKMHAGVVGGAGAADEVLKGSDEEEVEEEAEEEEEGDWAEGRRSGEEEGDGDRDPEAAVAGDF